VSIFGGSRLKADTALVASGMSETQITAANEINIELYSIAMGLAIKPTAALESTGDKSITMVDFEALNNLFQHSSTGLSSEYVQI